MPDRIEALVILLLMIGCALFGLYQFFACSAALARYFCRLPGAATVTVNTHYVTDQGEAELRSVFPSAFSTIPMVVMFLRTNVSGCDPQLPLTQQALQRHQAACPAGQRVLFTIQ